MSMACPWLLEICALPFHLLKFWLLPNYNYVLLVIWLKWDDYWSFLSDVQTDTPNICIHMEGTIGAGIWRSWASFAHNSHATFISKGCLAWLKVKQAFFSNFEVDPHGWGHTLDTYVCFIKAEGRQMAVPSPIIIMKRSIHSMELVILRLFWKSLMDKLEHGLLLVHYSHNESVKGWAIQGRNMGVLSYPSRIGLWLHQWTKMHQRKLGYHF
jgi:hypothetical protein